EKLKTNFSKTSFTFPVVFASPPPPRSKVVLLPGLDNDVVIYYTSLRIVICSSTTFAPSAQSSDVFALPLTNVMSQSTTSSTGSSIPKLVWLILILIVNIVTPCQLRSHPWSHMNFDLFRFLRNMLRIGLQLLHPSKNDDLKRGVWADLGTVSGALAIGAVEHLLTHAHRLEVYIDFNA
ncbi:hypothetical protein L195_g033780, partial [Trifolium pratense]